MLRLLLLLLTEADYPDEIVDSWRAVATVGPQEAEENATVCVVRILGDVGVARCVEVL